MTPGSGALEPEIQDVARKLAKAGESVRTRVFHMSWWADKMLDWAMAHPDFKTQLFRFVDVFPALRDDQDVLRHLSEYMDGVDVPGPLELGLDAAPKVPLGSRITASVARRNILRMADQLIAGATPAEAMPKLRNLWRSGEAATVDLLGEKTVTDEEGARYAQRVGEMLEALAAEMASWPDDPHLERDPWGDVPRVNVSVKPTALAPKFAPLTGEEGLEQALARLRPVCHRAKALKAHVHLDTEHYDVKDLTYELVRRLGAEFPDGPQLGVVVQAYLRESFDDLCGLVEWSRATLALPLSIRLVKGAYWDTETVVAKAEGWPVPVYEDKDHTDANYERCAEYLLDHAGEVRPAFGSHNLRSIAHAIVSARARSLHESAYEIQLLYGMAEPVHAALRRFGLRVRAYAPVGELVPGMAYLVRRLLENTSNESFLRHRYAEGRALDALVAPPDAGPDGLPSPAPDDRPPAAATDPQNPGLFFNEPHTELRRPGARAKLGAAVEAAPSQYPFEAPVLIAGRPVKTAEQIVSVDPGLTSRVICRAGRATASEAESAVAAARSAAAEWRRAPARERAGALFRAAHLMRVHRGELVALEVYEAGKPWAEADGDVAEAIDFCEYYGREAIRLAAGAPVLQVPGETNVYHYMARGTVAVISPWNFPLAIPCGMVTAALAMGNCVLFKPAEQTPGIAYRLVQILHQAGVPSGALAFLPGVGEEVGAYLVEHPEVSVIAFTGSKPVGLHIVERAGVHHTGQAQVKRVVAEMGGKNAVVVDHDADLDQAVPAIVKSAFGYAGQKCSAASRVVAVRAVIDELVARLAGATALVPVGHAAEMRTLCGPVIDEDAHKRVLGYQELAHSEGEVVYQRSDVNGGGWYAGPTVVVVNRPDARVATEEIFGPVLSVVAADDFADALEKSGHPEYALTAGIFSRSPAHIRMAAEELKAGNVYINRGITGALVGRQPFGGYALSGAGTKAGGPDYLLQFCDPRVVTENTIRQGFAPLES